MNNKKKLCVVVPFRDRYAHLQPFLDAIVPALNKKEIDFKIVIVEQTFTKQFNRGMMKNIGYLYQDADYYCFHDIDMLPIESDYSYCEYPTHLAEKVEQFNWQLPYPDFFGGVVMFTKEDFETIQGYSNDYWGWGAEDDDLRVRATRKELKLQRKPGVYRSLGHERPIIQEEYTENLRKYTIFSQSANSDHEDLKTCKYEILETVEAEHYTKITVEI
jgi:hypothetical protein